MKRATLIAFVALGLAGCAKEYKYEGDECVATSQCAEGLVCDLGVTPHVCSSQGTRPPDAGPPPPDADPTAPDAPPGTPDANTPPPDAAPDASLMIDATPA